MLILLTDTCITKETEIDKSDTSHNNNYTLEKYDQVCFISFTIHQETCQKEEVQGLGCKFTLTYYKL
jgi:hypothetical protein